MRTSSEVHNELILFPKALDRWIKLIITLLKSYIVVLGVMISPSLIIVSLNSGWRYWVSAAVSRLQLLETIWSHM